VMHQIFDIKNAEGGFADMITNVRIFGNKRGIKPTGIENLSVIPCGKIPGNPSELLSSSLARMIIQTLSEKYNVIIIDSPPVNTVTDPVILSRIVSGVVFVTRAGQTHRNMAQRAIEQLLSADAEIIGGVLNGIDFQKDRYYYYSYYSKYYREGDRRNKRRHDDTAADRVPERKVVG
jgi:capsular exopolysaccharide synthesis family protein